MDKRRGERWDMASYERWLRRISGRDEPADLYEDALHIIDEREEAPITIASVHEFLHNLGRYEDERFFSLSGLYLSAMINVLSQCGASASGDEIVIDLRHLKLLDFVGYRNRAHVVVYGDVGSNTGCEMECGVLHVYGNAFGSVGKRMKGGEILIEGDVGYWAGEGMRGGSIVVTGNAKDALGVEMEGGDIVVEGNAGSYVGRYMRGGRIVVLGNVGHWLGQFMSDGEIIVWGNAENGVGNWMRGGYIRIDGDAGELLGLNMLAGAIRIKNMVITCVSRR